MAMNLSRRLSSLINVSQPKLALSASVPDFATRSSPSSVKRFVTSSAYHHEQNKDELHQSGSETKNPTEAPDKQPDDSEESDDELDINKETGEIGGPKGPEPTRYGDWEKGGRCSDF